MKKIISLIITTTFFSVSGFAQLALEQSVIASGGGYTEGESVSLSWTVGELAITTLTGGDMILTQGFQQSFGFGTGITAQELNWKISAYPSPMIDVLFVKFDVDRAREFWIEIQDVTGRVIILEHQKEILPGDIVQLNTSNFTDGIYYLKVFTPDLEQLQVLGISKF